MDTNRNMFLLFSLLNLCPNAFNIHRSREQLSCMPYAVLFDENVSENVMESSITVSNLHYEIAMPQEQRHIPSPKKLTSQ